MENTNVEVQVAVAEKAEKVIKTLADYNLAEGEIVTIGNRTMKGREILKGRKFQVNRVSKADGFVKGQLINDKTGECQKCEIAMPVDAIIKAEAESEQVVA